MFEEFFQTLMEQWSHWAQQFFGQVGAAKIWGFMIPLVPAAYGVYIKWRNSGERMLDRLHEFLAKQEKRVADVREELAGQAFIPPGDNPYETPIFSERSLNRSLRRMRWGVGPAKVRNLKDAVKLLSDQAALSTRQAHGHRQRQALAYLLLGAKEASKNPSDSDTRHASRSAALAEFENALQLDPKDPEALQYSGLMLLQLSRAVEAAERFTELVSVRLSNGGKPLSDAYRLLATAYENWPNHRRLSDASGALTRAIDALPPGNPLDLALLNEQQGWVRLKAKVQRATQSFKMAEHLFSNLDTEEGRAGLGRVQQALYLLNEREGDGASMPQQKASEPTVPSD